MVAYPMWRLLRLVDDIENCKKKDIFDDAMSGALLSNNSIQAEKTQKEIQKFAEEEIEKDLVKRYQGKKNHLFLFLYLFFRCTIAGKIQRRFYF